jgi:signal transduction histidine kinase/PAS domain-containing protein
MNVARGGPLSFMTARKSLARRFAFSIAVFALAVLLTWIASPLLSQTVLLLLWPALVASAVYSGLGPTVAAATAAVLSLDLWVLDPSGSLDLGGPTGLAPLALFIVMAAVISHMATRMREEQRRAFLAEEEASGRAEQLAEQAVELEAQLHETNQLTEELEATATQMEQLTVEAEESRDEAERARAEIENAFEAVPDSVATFDSDLRLLYLNPVGRGILSRAGFDVDALEGKPLDRGIGEIGAEIATQARVAIAERRTVEFEQFTAAAGRWYLHRLVPTASGLLIISRDVTRDHRRVTEQRLLAEATTLLAEARLDVDATLANLARAVVPEFADWCSVQLLTENGTLKQLAVAHADPDKVRWAEELNQRYPPDQDAPHGAPQVARTGRSELHTEIPDEMLVRVARDDEHLKIIREVGLKSAMVVPIVGNDRVIGVLSMVAAESGRRYGEHDLAVAEELGRRAGLAVENSRLLSAEQRARSRAEEAVDRTSRLQRVTAALSRATTPGDVGRVVVTEGVTALGAQDGVIWVVNHPRGTLDLLRAVGISAQDQSRFRRVPLDAKLPIVAAMRGDGPLILSNRQEINDRFPEAAEQLSSLGSEAWLTCSLGSGEGALGVVAFGFDGPRKFDDDTVNFFSALASQCSGAIERARLMAAEQRARAEAEKANRVKTDFLTVMSHELRTPLNAIAGHAELLDIGIHGPVTEAQKDALARIRRSQRHLLGLINDVLNFAKLEAGHVSYDIRAVSVRSEIEALEPFISPQVAAKSLQYSCTAPADLAVSADPEKFRQILLNLLSNSVKFTPDGGEIAIRAYAADAEVLVEVRDTGMGIPEDKLEQVFAPFVQVGRGLTSVHEGTGLGLAISRDLAEGMNGSLIVESVEGEGACFTLALPRAPASVIESSGAAADR